MSFYALDFIFDDISSKTHNLQIISDNSKDDFTVLARNVVADKPSNSDVSYIVEAKDKDNLEFDLLLWCEHPLERYEIDKIQRWLCPKDRKYRKLYILQDDMKGYYYNCVITKIVATTYGNIPHVLKCTVECDSQYAWSLEKTKTYTFTTDSNDIKFYNNTSTLTTKPKYILYCNKADGAITITNNTTDVTMSLTGLSLDEVLTIDTRIMHISSSANLPRLSKFNKQFMELVQGTNELTVSGDITKLEIKYQTAKRYGG